MKPSKLLLLLFTPLFAADPPGLKLWTAQDLKVSDKSENRVDFGNHRATVIRRESNSEAEIHEDWNDVMVIESGEATVAIGGTLVNPHTTAPGQIRAVSSSGAEMKKLVPGDIIHIPANTPHQFLIAPGKQITYFELKIPAK